MANVAETMQRVIAPIAEDLVEVDKAVISDLQSDIPLIKKISDYIVSAGGKRMRPVVLLLIARMPKQGSCVFSHNDRVCPYRQSSP